MEIGIHKSRRWRNKALAALFAATASFAGGAQALAPAPAAAVVSEGTNCTFVDTFPYEDEVCVEEEGAGGVSEPTDDSGGVSEPEPEPDGASDPGPAEPGQGSNPMPEPPKAAEPTPEQKKVDDSIKSAGWGFPTWNDDSDESSRGGDLRRQRQNCHRAYLAVKRRIRRVYGNVDFDAVNNSGDRELEWMQDSFRQDRCGRWFPG